MSASEHRKTKTLSYQRRVIWARCVSKEMILKLRDGQHNMLKLYTKLCRKQNLLTVDERNNQSNTLGGLMLRPTRKLFCYRSGAECLFSDCPEDSRVSGDNTRDEMDISVPLIISLMYGPMGTVVSGPKSISFSSSK